MSKRGLLNGKHLFKQTWMYRYTVKFGTAHIYSEISWVLLGSWRGHGVRWYTVSSEISRVSLERFIHQNRFHSDFRRHLSFLFGRYINAQINNVQKRIICFWIQKERNTTMIVSIYTKITHSVFCIVMTVCTYKLNL